MSQPAREEHNMRIGTVSGFLILVLLCGGSADSAEDKKVKQTGAFSSLTYNREGGDLVGAEIKYVWTTEVG